MQLDGKRLEPRLSKRSRAEVRSLQIVFQNPDSALNRAHTVRRLVGRALSRLSGLSGAKREERLRELTSSIFCDEAQHATVLLGARHDGDPRAAVPEPFVTGKVRA